MFKLYSAIMEGSDINNRNIGYENYIVKVKVTLRLTVGQSVGLGIEPHLRPIYMG
jgi:hypothetical protein